MSAFPNIYTHRRVADTASKSCTICFKLSTNVLVTPDNKDFFYVCPSHLKDKQFATPIVDEAAAAAKKKAAMDAELEAVKKEYEEKQKKKKEKEKDKEKDEKKDAEESKDDEKKDKKKAEAKKSEEGTSTPTPEEEPRVFALHRTFYQQRIDKKKAAEIAKRQRERLQNPSFFPTVPKDLPSEPPNK